MNYQSNILGSSFTGAVNILNDIVKQVSKTTEKRSKKPLQDENINRKIALNKEEYCQTRKFKENTFKPTKITINPGKSFMKKDIQHMEIDDQYNIQHMEIDDKYNQKPVSKQSIKTTKKISLCYARFLKNFLSPEKGIATNFFINSMKDNILLLKNEFPFDYRFIYSHSS